MARKTITPARDPFRSARMRLAFGQGLRASVLVAVVLGLLVFVFSFVFRNLSDTLLAGKWAPEAPHTWGLYAFLGVLAFGGALTCFLTVKAAARPDAGPKIGGVELGEVKRWTPALVPVVADDADGAA